MAIQDPRQNPNHYIVLGYLCGNPLRGRTEYLGRHMWIPLQPLNSLASKYGLFAALRRDIPRPKTREASKNV